MRSGSAILIAGLAIVSLSTAAAGGDQAPAQGAEASDTLEVRVSDLDGRPLANAAVLIEGDDDFRFAGSTGKEGVTTLPGVLPDTVYSITVARMGYFSFDGVIYVDGPSEQFILQPIPDVPGIVEVPVRPQFERLGGENEPLFPELMEFLDEPALRDAATDESLESYRLLDQRPEGALTVRVELSEGTTPVLVAKALGTDPKTGGYGIVRSENRILEYAEVARILEQVDAIQFWTRATLAHTAVDGKEIVCSPHGPPTTIEGIKGGDYHYLIRVCALDGSPIRLLADQLLRISGLDVDRPEPR